MINVKNSKTIYKKMEKDYIKSGDFYYDGEEWTYFGGTIENFYEDEDDE